MVIHLAAFISAEESWIKPKEYFVNNALGTLSVIQNSVKAGVKKIIFFSSAAVKAKPLTPYALSKISGENFVKLYSKDIKTVIVRPENIYGLGQKADYGYVIHNFINAVKVGQNIKIFGKGNQSRDFIYIDDVVDVTRKLINLNIKSGSVISLGIGKPTKIINLANLVIKIMNKQIPIDYVKRRDEPLKSIADVSGLQRLGVDVNKFISLEKGIKRLVNTADLAKK